MATMVLGYEQYKYSNSDTDKKNKNNGGNTFDDIARQTTLITTSFM